MNKRTALEDLVVWANRLDGVADESRFIPRKSRCSDLFWNILKSSYEDEEFKINISLGVYDTGMRLSAREILLSVDILKVCMED